MGFGQGLSGLNAAAQNLDVIGNNIANSSTVGFRSSTASFADVYASSRVGLGVKVAAINQRFTVGNITLTGGQYDMAIDGEKGFFRVVDPNGAVLYTRNGQFTIDKNQFIVNAQGYNLTGYPVGGVGQAPVPLRLPTANVPPQATNAATTITNLNANARVISLTGTPGVPETLGTVDLDDGGGGGPVTYQFRTDGSGTVTWVTAPPAGTYNAGGSPITINASGGITSGSLAAQPGYTAYVAPVPAVAPVPFNPRNANTYTNSVPMTVYDSLGNSHQLVQYFAKREAAGGNSVYDTYYTLDGQAMAPTTEAGGVWGSPTTLTFDTAGRLLNAPPTVALSFATPGGTNSPALPMTINLDYTGTTQFGNSFNPKFTQNGYASGEFSGISVDKDGSMVASYTNGKTAVVGTLVLADFNNSQGLTPVGDNAWEEGAASGQAVLGQPGTNGLATIAGQAVEESNVDMSRELVSMIIAQRTYQANSQTIKTQDEILQTLINMR